MPATKKILLLLFLICSFKIGYAQKDGITQQSSIYEWPKDPLVRQKLDEWQDKKFGMLIHWGLYSVPGITESWPLCSEDWVGRDSTIIYDDFKKWYWGISKVFNPVKFNPDQWATAGKSAGMKYVIFTTKHHDGFAMFDTKFSDFSIAKGPFAGNPKADVAKYVFASFRKQGFMIGAYFSKPDWHSQYYWWDKYATADRNNNYDIRKNPWRWNQFKEYTFNQIGELMHNYGNIDILWLDGGWVRPLETVDDEVRSWGARIPEWSQDIDIPKIAAMARNSNPGMLVVDRTVHGPYENYQTPEQAIPAKQLDYPWESCLTLGGAWGFVKNDNYKSAKVVIDKLVEIVAKGGNLVLGVGPNPDGTLNERVVNRLNEIGQWTTLNGKAIYSTRITKNYHSGQTWFTQSKDGATGYAIYCLKDGEKLPTVLSWDGNIPKKGSTIKLISNGKKIKWKAADGKVNLYLDNKDIGAGNNIALAFEFVMQK